METFFENAMGNDDATGVTTSSLILLWRRMIEFSLAKLINIFTIPLTNYSTLFFDNLSEFVAFTLLSGPMF